MSNIEFFVGDLIKSDSRRDLGFDGNWFGIILEDRKNQPKVYPIYANKYKIKWCGGTTSWHWGSDIDLVARVNRT
jgi:hypothetical protein